MTIWGVNPAAGGCAGARFLQLGENMRRHRYLCGLLFFIVALVAALASSSSAETPATSVYLPACGPDPNANTRALQQAINDPSLPPGSTLVLPAGVCVLAKCDVAQGAACYTKGAGQYFSAVDIGLKQNLTLAGAPDASSVLKLDPNPPRRADGSHAYCGAAHVLSIRKSTHITLRDFVIDGSDGELPEDTSQCSTNGGRISVQMQDVQVENSTDITIERMQLTRAHGDGLSLIANHPSPTPTPPYIPFTERVSVTNTYFLDNGRAGVAFQRNVGYVAVRLNYFQNSGDAPDVQMQAAGGASGEDLGPYEVEIHNNLFVRVKPGLAVTLGAVSTQPSSWVLFTNNTIEGGCISVSQANSTVIAGNTVNGAPQCVPLSASKINGLYVTENDLAGYANVTDKATGYFVPKPVMAISEAVVKQGGTGPCGAPPQPQPCPYYIHYPDWITLRGNIITQHVQNSPAVSLGNVDELLVEGNFIRHTHAVAPAGPLNPRSPVPRPTSIDLSFGIPLGSSGYFVNERTRVNRWTINRNGLNQFADGIRVRRLKVTVSVDGAELNGNQFRTAQSSPQGIWLVGAPGDAQSGFIDYLMVDRNLFGCGFEGPSGEPPPHAFVRPSGQTHGGNVGARMVCLQ